MKVEEIVRRAITEPEFATQLRQLVQAAAKEGPGSPANEAFARLFVDNENQLKRLLNTPAFSNKLEDSAGTCWKTQLLSTPACSVGTTTTASAPLNRAFPGNNPSSALKQASGKKKK